MALLMTFLFTLFLTLTRFLYLLKNVGKKAKIKTRDYRRYFGTTLQKWSQYRYNPTLFKQRSTKRNKLIDYRNRDLFGIESLKAFQARKGFVEWALKRHMLTDLWDTML